VFVDFQVPGADPNTTQATAVNEKGQTVGTAGFSGVPLGWYYDDTSYSTKLSMPGSTGTYPMGINWEGQVVGYYTDYQQNTHGFLLLNPGAPPSEQTWETIDEPNASNYTVVSHINTHRYITGWYKDSNGHLHGFVGTCVGSNC
jgi:probable HAF family extracellular repeat protein